MTANLSAGQMHPMDEWQQRLESGLPAASEQLRHRAVVDDLRAKLDHRTDELSHANRVVGSQQERIDELVEDNRDLRARVGDLRLALHAESERADAAEAKLGEGPVQP